MGVILTSDANQIDIVKHIIPPNRYTSLYPFAQTNPLRNPDHPLAQKVCKKFPALPFNPNQKIIFIPKIK